MAHADVRFKAPPPQPEVDTVALTLTQAEAQMIYDVFGCIGAPKLKYLASNAHGRGTTKRLRRAATDHQSEGAHAVSSVWDALHELTGERGKCGVMRGPRGAILHYHDEGDA